MFDSHLKGTKESRISAIFGSERTEEVFPELATSLYSFISRLHAQLLEKQVTDICFLSREGQFLMRLFEMYTESRRDDVTPRMRCHYLEVSRRATFLPSLGPLAEETFETLFRQYRNISIHEFLSSLGLEAHAEEIARDLNISERDLAIRMEHLVSQPLYKQLLNCERFQRAYELERLLRREAFVAYLQTFFAGSLPDTLHIVDVGWKGTIQDNLYNLLCRGDTGIKSIEGYYVGLIAAGAANSRNRKQGILFSATGGKSPGFAIFNENRALFEIVLAADHGSAAGYCFDSDGKPKPVRDHFEEADIVTEFVVPIQERILARFSELQEHSASEVLGANVDLRKAAARYHSRMVFQPTEPEICWFSTVYHVENFGVFEHSRFGDDRNGESFLHRLKFSLKLILFPRRIQLGFWPWLSIRRRGFSSIAHVYRLIRTGSVK